MMATYLEEEPADENTPPDWEEIRGDMDVGLQELKNSHGGYEEAEDYFLGRAEEKFISDKLRKMLSGSVSDFHVNLAGRVVHAVTDRLEIAAVTASRAGDREEDDPSTAPEDQEEEPDSQEEEPPDQEDQDPSEDQTPSEGRSGGVSNESDSGSASSGSDSGENGLTAILSERVWRHNDMDIESPDVHEKATSLGDAYIYVGLSEDEENIDMFYNSPYTARAIYDPENPRKVRFVIKRWTVGVGDRARVRVNMYYPFFHFKFQSKAPSTGDHARVKGDKSEDFEPYLDDFTDNDGMVDYPYEEIPFFHFRTARPYGRPEHQGAYGPQDAITKLITGQMITTDFAAYPQRWALNETGTSGNDDDIDWGDEDDEAPEEKHSALVSGPGRVWMLDNVKAVGQFATADPDAFLKPLDKFIELMGSATGTPLSYLHKVRGTSSTPLSGQSQKQTEVMLLKKIQARQRSYEATWRDAFQFALKLLGHDARVSIQWASSQVDNDKSVWDGVLAQQNAGVPKRQTLLEQGYTEKEVESWGYTEDSPDGDSMQGDPNDPFVQNANAPLPQDMEGNEFQPGQGGNNGPPQNGPVQNGPGPVPQGNGGG